MVVNYKPYRPPVYYSLSIDITEPAAGRATGAGRYQQGETVTLHAYANSNGVFRGWYQNGELLSTGESYTLTVEGDLRVEARFAIYCTVTLDISPDGAGTVEGAGTYLSGDTVTLQAVSGEEYTFDGWKDENGDLVSASAELEFIIAGDRKLTANFKFKRVVVLPAGYTLLQYIESPSTMSGINTEFKAQMDASKVVLDIEAKELITTPEYILSSSGSDRILYISRTAENEIRCGVASQAYSIEQSITGKRLTIILDCSMGKLQVGENETGINTISYTKQNDLYLLRGSKNSRGMPSKIYSMQIYNNDVLVRDYVPAQSDAGIVGLFDLASNKMYQSAWTDSTKAPFAAGPAV